jgi:hypothetical protein
VNLSDPTTTARSAGVSNSAAIGPMSMLLASALVFVTSGAVLVLEILAGRLLAPYVGVTLETFTGIIGVVLAGIALGTWLGGRLADRHDPRRLLPPCLVIGGGLSILAVPLIRWMGEGLGRSGPLAVVVLSSVGFLLPSAILSAASPLVVKIQLTDLSRTGQVVGRLSAVGTAGSLVGVFATGFILIAAFPTTPVILVVGGALAVAGLALWWHFDRDAGAGAGAGAGAQAPGITRTQTQRAMLGGLVLAAGSTGLAVTVTDPCEVETAYFCARVVVDEERPSGRILVLDTLQHSYVDLDDPRYLRFGYTRIFGDVVDVIEPTGPLEVVHIGGGGFTVPQYVAATRPGSRNLVFELDPKLIDLAESELGLVLDDRVQARSGDARTNMRRHPDGSADLVIGDAFGGLAVPWHLTTREFLEEVQRTLRPEGIYALNVIDGQPLRFLTAQMATIEAVFAHLALVAPPQRLDGSRGGNFVVLASDSPLPVAAITERIEARSGSDRVLADPAELRAFIGEAQILVDDHAPVDQLFNRPR